MQVYSDGKTRVIKGKFPKRFKLLNAGVDVPFLRTAKDAIRLSGEIPVGNLDIEEVISKKTAQPAQLDAASLAIINKSDFDKIDILNKKLAINQEQMNAHLSALTEQEATLANLETQNAQAIEQTNNTIVEMAHAFGKEIQADRESIKKTEDNMISSINDTGLIINSRIDAHEKAKNPHKISKATIGLERVDNTSDEEKPISNAVKKALDKKADKSDIDAVNKKISDADKKSETIIRNLDTLNLYGGVGGNELPSGGKKGQVLKKKSNKTGEVEWGDEPVVSNAKIEIKASGLEVGSFTLNQTQDAVINLPTTYIHEQGIASATWTINHNLNKFPAVSIVDSAGNEIIAEVKYEDLNTCIVTMTGASKGKAFLN